MKGLYNRNFGRLLMLLLVIAGFSPHAQAQATVSGRVTSAEGGEALPGVNVIIKGTSEGTITDTDGRYSITVSSGQAVVVYSYVGHVSEEVVVGERSVINVVLTPDLTTLSEVVVVGYGTEKKKDLTGSIATVSSQDFARVPAINPLDALAARAPGLNITSSSGMPGANANVLIRGVTSFGDNNNSNGAGENDFVSKNSPIYVVDGLITEGINNLSPNDIQSISVLKDASATAIYGSRAANGVILVTTKRGAGKGKPTISFNAYVGVQKEGNLKRKLLNSEQYIEIFTESYDNEGQTKQWTDADLLQYEGVNTDWKKAITRTGILQNYELSVMGGGDNSNYYISGGYKDNTLMVKSYDFKKYTLMFNSDHKINDWVKFGNSLNLYSTETNGATRGLGETYWQDALTSVPIKRAYEEDGRYGYPRNLYLENGGNLLFSIDNNVDNTKYRGLMGNIYLTFQLMKGLNFTAKQSLEWEQRYVTTFRAAAPTYLTNGNITVNNITKDHRQTAHTITDFLVDYNKQLGEHTVTALLGYSIEEWQRETLEAFRSGTPNNSIQFIEAGDQATQTNGNEFNDWSFLSMFGRVNYSFQDKYLAAATIRRDGSSKLAAGKRYGVFPSVSFGWRISKEAFMRDATWVNDLKLRGSWGTVGNVNGLRNYATAPALNNFPYSAAQQIVPGYTLSAAINRDITWETTIKKNIGLDASVLNNHVYTNLDFYIEDTHDLLFDRPIPLSAGKNSDPFVNAGKVRNTGFEMILGYVTTVNDWNFDASFNLASNRNEVIDLDGADFRTSGIIEGYPVRSFFGYASDGIITSQEELDANPQGPLFANKELGDILILDVSGRDENGNLTGVPDGQVNADDRWIIGRRYPKAVYGFMGTVGYKDFTLQVQLQGVTGLDRDIGTSNDYGLFHYYQRWALNHDAMILDRWHATKNPDGEMPRVDIKDTGKNRELSDFWLRDASYLRIKNVNLNYNLPRTLIEKAKMREMGVYFTVQNLWTFTRFPGQEVDSTVDPMTGVPQPRTYTLGFRATF